MASLYNHSFHSPLRYPGGKGIIANFMKLFISQNSLIDGDYVEIYSGGAGVAWALLFEEYVQRVHINDLNSALVSFWKAATEETEELCKLIQDTPVTMEEWHRQKIIQQQQKDFSIVQIGFSTFFLNRTNRSGILKGGVIGGKGQTGIWKLDARFNKQDLILRVQRIARYANRIKIYDLDAAHFIQNVLPSLPQKTLVYLDPPYYKKGQDLYENHYTGQDHDYISSLVTNIKQPWIVSYDSVPEIITLYEGYPKIQYNISYSAQGHYAGSEVMFFAKDRVIPKVTNPAKVKFPIGREYS